MLPFHLHDNKLVKNIRGNKNLIDIVWKNIDIRKYTEGKTYLEKFSENLFSYLQYDILLIIEKG